MRKFALCLIAVLSLCCTQAALSETPLQNQSFYASNADRCFHRQQDCIQNAESISLQAAYGFEKTPCPKCTGMEVFVNRHSWQGLELLTIAMPKGDGLTLTQSPALLKQRQIGDREWLFILGGAPSGQLSLVLDGEPLPCALVSIPDKPEKALLLYGESGMDFSEIPREALTADETAYAFMGGSARTIPFGQGFLCTVTLLGDVPRGYAEVRFGEMEMSAESYHRIWGRYWGGFEYSEEKRAYISEMGEMYDTVTAPAYRIGVQAEPMETGTRYTWYLTPEEYAAQGKSNRLTFAFESGSELSFGMDISG